MKVKILTEAGNQIGMGHLTRCSSLYDEVASRGIETELFVFGDSSLTNADDNRKVTKCNWLEVEFIEGAINHDDFVIVDSYLADVPVYEAIVKQSKKAVFIDDINRIQYPEGIIVNPSLNGTEISYPMIAGQQILTGPEYIILRDPFIGRNTKNISNKVQRALVMMGGTDVKQLTSVLISKLAPQNPNVMFDIIVPESKYDDYKMNLVFDNGHYHTNVDANTMAGLMNQADVVITAAGQSIFELIALKKPFLAVKTIENQTNNVKAVSERIADEIIFNSEDTDFMNQLEYRFNWIQDYNNRNRILNQMAGLIDCKGSKRIIDALIGNEIIIRNVKQEDIEVIFNLSNQESVRKHSINNSKINWEDHVKWFNMVHKSDKVLFYIVTSINNQVLGQVRFNVAGSSAVISISLDEVIRGKGLAKKITTVCINKVLSEIIEIDQIIAFVSEKNIPSMKLFMQLNFEKSGYEEEMVKLVLKKGAFNVTR